MITRRLPVFLNERDVLDRGQKLAQAEYDYSAIEADKKSANEDFKKSLEATESRIANLSAAIRERVEIQDVEVVIEDDGDRLEHRIVRRDTGETVETYPFTEQEKQKRLFVS